MYACMLVNYLAISTTMIGWLSYFVPDFFVLPSAACRPRPGHFPGCASLSSGLSSPHGGEEKGSHG